MINFVSGVFGSARFFECSGLGTPAGAESVLIPTVTPDGVIGCVAPDKTVLIKPRFYEATFFHGDYTAPKQAGGLWVVVDRRGREILSGDDDAIRPAVYTEVDSIRQPLESAWFVVDQADNAASKRPGGTAGQRWEVWGNLTQWPRGLGPGLFYII